MKRWEAIWIIAGPAIVVFGAWVWWVEPLLKAWGWLG